MWKKFTCGSFEMASKMSREHFSICEFLFRATVMWPGTAPRVRVCAPAPAAGAVLSSETVKPPGGQLHDRRAPGELDNSRGHLRHSERASNYQMDPEQAKQIAKCIPEALTGAGLQIVPLNNE